MIYTIYNNIVIASYEDTQYSKLKDQPNIFWIDKQISSQKVNGFNEETGTPIFEQNTYILTYEEKLNSLRFKRDYLLNSTDKGVTTDSPLLSEYIEELKTYRQSLRDFTDNVDESNIDTYILPLPSQYLIDWCKL